MDGDSLPLDPDDLGGTGGGPSVSPDFDVLAVVALGGGLGSLARYGVAELVRTEPGTFPLSTFVVNIVGCALIGVLMVFVVDVWAPHRYARPFLGVGVLGGFTTFSTMMLDLRTLGSMQQWVVGATYLLGSVVVGLVAVGLAVSATRALTRSRARG